jgi:hypothetical protein
MALGNYPKWDSEILALSTIREQMSNCSNNYALRLVFPADGEGIQNTQTEKIIYLSGKKL